MKFSSGIFFSFVLGFIAFLISSLGVYWVINDPENELVVVVISAIIGVLALALALAFTLPLGTALAALVGCRIDG